MDTRMLNMLMIGALGIVFLLIATGDIPAYPGSDVPGEDPVYCDDVYSGLCLSFIGLYVDPPVDHIEGHGVGQEFCRDYGYLGTDCAIMSVTNHSPDVQELSWSYQSSQTDTYCHALSGMPEDVDYLYHVGERVCMKSTNDQTGWFNNGVFQGISSDYEYNIQRNTAMMAIDCSGLNNEQCITKHDNVMSTGPVDREWGNELFFVATIGVFGLILINRKQIGV